MGFSLGANLGSEERSLVVYGFPHVRYEVIDFPIEDNERGIAPFTDKIQPFEAVEFGAQIQLTPIVFADLALSWLNQAMNDCCAHPPGGRQTFFYSVALRVRP